MARIILSIIFLVVLVVLIVMNAGASAPVNVFGWQVEEVSIIVIGLVCFVTGIVFSFIFYLMSALEKGRRDRLAKRKRKLKDQEADLKTREQEVGIIAEESKRQLETAQTLQSGAEKKERVGLFTGLRRGRKTGEHPPTEERTL